MYEELVGWLRSWSELPAHCECYESCEECNKQDICATFTNESIIAKAGEAADAIEELSKPRWIPVTERLPEVRTWVLCYCRANSFDVFRMTDEGNWQYGNRSIYMKGYVTHWMPLPPAPKEESYGV